MPDVRSDVAMRKASRGGSHSKAAGIVAAFLGVAASVFYNHKRRRVAAQAPARSARPQDFFKQVLADNSDIPFQHLNPASASPDSAPSSAPDTVKPRKPEHPYQDAINGLSEEAQHSLLKARKLEEWKPGEQVPSVWVATLGQLQAAMEQLRRAHAIGVDVEHNHLRSYRGIVCLLQLSTGNANFIIDALALHDDLSVLQPIFADASILKVIHGGESDVLWLQRDFHIYTINVFDTEKACKVLGKKKRSLAHLLMEYFGVFQDKRFQLADWRTRPLPEDMMDYAVADAHFLIYLAAALCKEFEYVDSQAGKQKKTLPSQAAMQLCKDMCLLLYSKTSSQEAVNNAVTSVLKWQQISESGDRGARLAQSRPLLTNAVRELCSWRDAIAREQDEGVQYIMPDAVLLKIAKASPKAQGELLAIARSWADTAADSASEQAANMLSLLTRDAAQICRGLDWAAANAGKHIEPEPLPGHQTPTVPQKLSKAEKRQRMAAKFSAKSVVYENCRMLSQQGELLCYCDARKLEWYLAKGLADKVTDEPPTIRLNFEHSKADQTARHEAFYSSSRDNRCVACGSQRNYLRYRVVPTCYRKHFPVQQKSHRSHDVLLLCFDCHEVAHKASEAVKRDIARETGIPLLPPPVYDSAVENAPHPNHVRHAAIALLNAGHKMPTGRRQELEAVIVRYLAATGTLSQADIDPKQLPPALVPSTVITESKLSTADNSDSGADKPLHASQEPGSLAKTREELAVTAEAGGSASAVQLGNSEPGTCSAAAGEPSTGGVADESSTASGRGENEHAGCAKESRMPNGMEAAAGCSLESLSVPECRSGMCASVADKEFIHQNDDFRLPPAAIHLGLLAGLGPRQRKRKLQRLGLQEDGQSVSQETGRASLSEATEDELGSTSLPDAQATSASARDAASSGEEAEDTAEEAANRNAEGYDDDSAEKPAGSGLKVDSSEGAGCLHDDVSNGHGGSMLCAGRMGGKPEPGHMAHGRQVVAAVMKEGGEEALGKLVQRFRAAFVYALDPQFLPPYWQVDHSAAREFGSHSIYEAEHGR